MPQLLDPAYRQLHELITNFDPQFNVEARYIGDPNILYPYALLRWEYDGSNWEFMINLFLLLREEKFPFGIDFYPLNSFFIFDETFLVERRRNLS